MRTWAEIAARQGRNDLPHLLVAHLRDLSDDDLRTAIAQAWTRAEWPEQALPASTWVALFDTTGYQVDGKPGNIEDLPTTVTLWRGATLDRRDGMSWTGNPQTAKWFARRFTGMDQGTALFRITVPREYVLARFVEGREEDEYVVDTTTFEDDEYTVVQQFPPTH